jgi:hypothetical protein
MNPHQLVQVRFENEPGTPTKEFKACELSEPTFDALVTRVFRMTSYDGPLDQYNVTFKYHIEASRWVNFDSTEGLGYAIQNNQDKGYVFLSANIVKKGATALSMVAPSPVRSAKDEAKPRVAKTSRTTKQKTLGSQKGTRTAGPRGPVILSTLKNLLDLGIDAPPRLQVAMFTGYSNVDSATFKGAMKKLMLDGLIEYPDKGTVSLTAAGIAQAPSVTTPATTNEEVQTRLKSMLKAKGPLIFNILKDGRSHACQQVANTVGHSNVQSAGF